MKNVAVIITTCNRPFLLRNLVGSLRPQLTEGDAIIIVNDGDPDSVSIEGDNIYVVEHCKPYYAVASARNAGMDKALGLGYDWGLFLDDDIEISDDLVEEHKNAWADKKTVYSGKITEPGSDKDARKKWWDGKGSFTVKWGGSTLSCHLPSLKEVGGYNEDFDGAWGYEDNELYYRLTNEYDWDIEYLEDAVVENLKAPTNGNYERYSTENKEKLPSGATY